MKRLWLLGILVMSVSGCVYPYPGTSHRTAVITNNETGETSTVDTIEETSVPAPWVTIGSPSDWTYGPGGWTYLGVPYYYYGAPYFSWGIGGLYAPTYVYRSVYWYGPRWYGYRGHGPGWRGWNNRWYGSHRYRGPKHGYRGGKVYRGTSQNIPRRSSVNRGGAVHRSNHKPSAGSKPAQRRAPVKNSSRK